MQINKDIMKTAVEWFYQRILAKDIKEVLEQAKEMEKKQIMDAWLDGTETKWDSNKYAEHYYYETFKSE